MNGGVYNAEEGKAIVYALVSFLNSHQVLSMVTTHYGGMGLAGRKLRVRGFIEEKIHGALTIHHIDRLIDYSLIEETDEIIPHEALRIAE